MARRLARRYWNTSEPFDDLVQVASMGLLAAIDRFDPDRGMAFPAFAVPTVLGELKRYFRNTGWSAHVPRHAQELSLRVAAASRELAATSGRSPSVAELSQYLEISTEDVLTGLEAGAAHYSLSLEAPVNEAADEPTSLGDTIGREDDGYDLIETTTALATGICALTFPERRALALRLTHDLKQSEIAERLGCSQMQVSRLLRGAAAKLRACTDAEVTTPGDAGS